MRERDTINEGMMERGEGESEWQRNGRISHLVASGYASWMEILSPLLLRDS